MSLLSKLFGGGGRKPGPEPVEHNGFTIHPEPVAESGGYRIAARIEQDGKVHNLIRADVIQNQDEAMEATINKAKQAIDTLGERIFG